MRVKLTEKQLKMVHEYGKKKKIKLTESQFNKLFNINSEEAKKSFNETFGEYDMGLSLENGETKITLKEFAMNLKEVFKDLMKGDASSLSEMADKIKVDEFVLIDGILGMGIGQVVTEGDSQHIKIKKDQIKEKIKELYEYVFFGDDMKISEYGDPAEAEPEYSDARQVDGPAEVEFMNKEIAIFKLNGKPYLFNYVFTPEEEFLDYVEREVDYHDEDEDGKYPVYTDDVDITYEAIQSYLNDNLKSLSVGVGVAGEEDGKDIVEIDGEVLENLLQMFPADADAIRGAVSMEEATGAASAGAYVAPAGKTPKPIAIGTSLVSEDDVEKEENQEDEEEEIEEGTTTASSGSYVQPAFLAKDKKNHRFGKKPMYPKGTIVAEDGSENVRQYMNRVGGAGMLKGPNFEEGDQVIADLYNDETGEVDREKLTIKSVSGFKPPKGEFEWVFTAVEYGDNHIFPGDVIVKKIGSLKEEENPNDMPQEIKDKITAYLENNPNPSPYVKRKVQQGNYKEAWLAFRRLEESNLTTKSYSGGKFVEFDDCVRPNNNTEAQEGGCSQGAVDNVVKLKDTLN